ncbi:MAG: spore maturation protein [Oscillospiraceae bacterium]
MKLIGELAVPVIIALVMIYAMRHGTDVFSGMTAGARDGLKTVLGIVPALITLLPCIYMLRASGAIDALCALLSPLLSKLGIPPETVPLMLLRPLSGSGALAIGSDIIKSNGADSFIGRCAAVMLGSTETTFYVIAVYFGAAGIKNSRHAIPAALIADLTGLMAAAFFTRLFWG